MVVLQHTEVMGIPDQNPRSTPPGRNPCPSKSCTCCACAPCRHKPSGSWTRRGRPCPIAWMTKVSWKPKQHLQKPSAWAFSSRRPWAHRSKARPARSRRLYAGPHRRLASPYSLSWRSCPPASLPGMPRRCHPPCSCQASSLPPRHLRGKSSRPLVQTCPSLPTCDPWHSSERRDLRPRAAAFAHGSSMK